MQRKYFVIFIVLLCIPLVALVAVITYCCFKAGKVAGIAALFGSLLFVALIISIALIKSKKRK